MKRFASLGAILMATLVLGACGGEKAAAELTTTPEAKQDVRNVLEGYMTLLVKNDPRICDVVDENFFATFTGGAYPTCEDYIKINEEGGTDYTQVKLNDISIDGGETLDDKTFEFDVEMATNDPNMYYRGFSLKVSAAGDKWVLSDFAYAEDAHRE